VPGSLWAIAVPAKASMAKAMAAPDAFFQLIIVSLPFLSLFVA
jgi:hypothetical protein